MTTNRYKLIFEGKIVTGRKIEEVKRNLSSLYKTDNKKIERLFTNQPILIKKDVDYQVAMKYKEAFERTGAICKIEEFQKSEGHPPSSLKSRRSSGNNMNGKAQRTSWKKDSHFGSKKGFLKIIFPVLGGMFIGLLATMILKFMSGKFSF